MAYIGKTPLVGNYQICDALTASATADYTLQVGGVNVSPQSANAMIVSLNSVIQGPGASRGFTVSGSTISFNSALTSSDVIDFIYIFGDVLDIGTPTDDSVSAAKIASNAVTTVKILDDNVTTAKIADNNVTLAKLADGTQGDILYYGASGAPALLGFGTSGDFLKTQGTGANPTWATAAGGKIGQVVTTVKTDTTSATSIEVFVDITGMTRAITPTATSSKVLIEVTLAIGLPNNAMLNILLLNGTTGIFLGDAASNRTRASAYVRGPTDATHGCYNVSFAYIDSPSSTSEVTYKLQWHSNTATYYLNRTEQDDDYVRYPRTASSIICSEILA